MTGPGPPPSSAAADAFRRWGYLQAELDPLGRLKPVSHPELEAEEAAAPEEAARWRALYCGAIGAEFAHVRTAERCAWIAARMEEPPPRPAPEIWRALAARVAEVELFERFMHARYVGTKRYSLEGSAALIPLLDAILDEAASGGVEVVLLAMSHRGRLNVMAHIVHVPVASIFAAFEDVDPRSVLGGGDVKYHIGASGTYTTPSDRSVHVRLVSNPSHLEAVDPVLMGRARARQTRLGPSGRGRVLPVALHGDAAFAGQGIVAETLNMMDLPATCVGGTIHVLVNNLIGFTTTPRSLHSSRYASDVARRLDVPIFHVNGEAVDAVARAGRLAAGYRAAFGSDVVVDLIGYRRYGHSEVDDPTMTQPILYRGIERREMLWKRLASAAGLGETETEAIESGVRARLDAAQAEARGMTEVPSFRRMPPHWEPYRGGPYSPSLEVPTAVPAGRLAEIGRAIASAPAGFRPHPKVQRLLVERAEMAEGRRPVDWGMAEALAFGSLLWEGVPVRLAGQDSRRGTFAQRHAVLHDHDDEREHVPLACLREGQGFFEIHDTHLSEAAALGFEYGFSRDYPEALVCWEAQFGDFANGAQIILDQFVSAAEDKWGLLSGIVILLPHGYEGQGPEHSSARLERYLQLAGEDNIQICQPTTAAQYFHLLRRQALRPWRKPLIVMTPKGLLRAPAAASPVEELAGGGFRPVVVDPAAGATTRLLLCTGKVAHELAIERTRRQDRAVSIVRIEQLYPWAEEEVSSALASHASAREIVWVQEEPANMGALAYALPLLERAAGGRSITTVKRSASASPATGSAKAHAIEQKALLELAFARFA